VVAAPPVPAPEAEPEAESGAAALVAKAMTDTQENQHDLRRWSSRYKDVHRH
jgi:hypothetical protein